MVVDLENFIHPVEGDISELQGVESLAELRVCLKYFSDLLRYVQIVDFEIF